MACALCPVENDLLCLYFTFLGCSVNMHFVLEHYVFSRLSLTTYGLDGTILRLDYVRFSQLRSGRRSRETGVTNERSGFNRESGSMTAVAKESVGFILGARSHDLVACSYASAVRLEPPSRLIV